MIVQMQKRGTGVTDLNIGARNAVLFFPKDTSRVELHLDHLQIQCDLRPSFWTDEPLISDPRLSAWLEQKKRFREPASGASVLVMVPVEKQAFRLRLASTRTVKQEGEGVLPD